MLITALTLAALAGPAPDAGAITWYDGTFFAARGDAGKSDKQLLVYFWADGSEQCAKMYGVTMAEDLAVDAMDDYVCWSANTADAKAYELVEQYNVKSLPTVLVVNPDGTVEDAIVGFIDPGGFAYELARIGRGEDTIPAFRERAAKDPRDLDAQYELSVKLADCGVTEEAERIVQRMKAEDPKGAHVVVARLLLEDAKEPVIESARQEDGEYDFKTVNLEPMEVFLKKTKHPEIRFEGWAWIAAVHAEGEDLPAARAASMVAWKDVPEERAIDFGSQLTESFFEQREELDKKEKMFVLAVANDVVKAFDAYAEKVLADAEQYESGCASADGCAEGEGCGGCPGAKAALVCVEAGTYDKLALAYYINGKRKKAIDTIQRSLALEPENEAFVARLATFEEKG